VSGPKKRNPAVGHEVPAEIRRLAREIFGKDVALQRVRVPPAIPGAKTYAYEVWLPDVVDGLDGARRVSRSTWSWHQALWQAASPGRIRYTAASQKALAELASRLPASLEKQLRRRDALTDSFAEATERLMEDLKRPRGFEMIGKESAPGVAPEKPKHTIDLAEATPEYKMGMRLEQHPRPRRRWRTIQTATRQTVDCFDVEYESDADLEADGGAAAAQAALVRLGFRIEPVVDKGEDVR